MKKVIFALTGAAMFVAGSAWAAPQVQYIQTEAGNVMAAGSFTPDRLSKVPPEMTLELASSSTILTKVPDGTQSGVANLPFDCRTTGLLFATDSAELV